MTNVPNPDRPKEDDDYDPDEQERRVPSHRPDPQPEEGGEPEQDPAQQANQVRSTGTTTTGNPITPTTPNP